MNLIAHLLGRLLPAACLATGLMLAMAADAAVVEEVIKIPVKVKDSWGKDIEHELVVTLWRDDKAPQPYPVAVVNHGRDAEPAGRAAMGRAKYTANSRWLAQQGFLVAVPTRIGYGETGGPDLEDSGTCSRKTYPPVYLAAAAQTLQVLDAVRQRPDAAKDRAVIVGQSFGGATSIAIASLNPPGVQGAINFAGGGGGNPKDSPQQPCATAALERMLGGFGKTARVPTLWVYSENDMYFGPKYPKEWFDAYKAAGGAGDYVLYPPNGKDGHSLFTAAPDVWRAKAVEFLKSIGYESAKQ